MISAAAIQRDVAKLVPAQSALADILTAATQNASGARVGVRFCQLTGANALPATGCVTHVGIIAHFRGLTSPIAVAETVDGWLGGDIERAVLAEKTSTPRCNR